MLADLYQEIIIDHGRHPRNFGAMMDGDCCQQQGYNPLCGDRLTLYLKEKAKQLILSFEGSGCAISMASASLMTEMLQHKTKAEAFALFQDVHQLLTDGNVSEEANERLGKLIALQGVHAYPMRVKCATLAWHTLKAVLIGDKMTVKTEE